jgi:hypothetical protein
MARTDVPVTSLTANAENDNPGTTALDATNGHSIDVNGVTDRLLIEVKNTFAGSKTFTVKAGANPPAVRAGLGDLAVVQGAQNDISIVVLEASRFVQADGKVYVDLAASMTGTIRAIRLPAV